jgi:hypothetical protein
MTNAMVDYIRTMFSLIPFVIFSCSLFKIIIYKINKSKITFLNLYVCMVTFYLFLFFSFINYFF